MIEPGERRLIFIVDDEAAIHRALARALRKAPYDVHCFASPLEALARIEELRPDLIISDNQMPDMIGADFLRQVRAEWPAIRTLLLTGGPLAEGLRMLVAGGVLDGLMAKPWDDVALWNAVQTLVDPQQPCVIDPEWERTVRVRAPGAWSERSGEPACCPLHSRRAAARPRAR